ncbi:tryptophan halogenase family protein [Pseudocolwellia agarivorans]|uniref:tryptophan halogenase family protein n=1 Tax=Pseudocolwellia agarivorans TaxID=1911682 RepID=UPI003F883BF2
MNSPIKKIVIVGGGSAGWLTAGIIATEHKNSTQKSLNITLIESPDVKTIGVGEGTWPSMRNTLDKIGITEFEFIQQCDASFKQGSKFIAWQTGSSDEFYYHPFMTPDGYPHTNLQEHWQRSHAQRSFADTVNVQSYVCEAGLAPKQFATPPYASVTNYGYHLNAGKFAALLQKHCTQKLGINHVIAHIDEVISGPSGDIEKLSTKDGQMIDGDLFIDCSGSTGLLINKHFKIPFIKQDHVLFNNSALATQVPYIVQQDIASATLSTAQTCGWIWDIGLPSRRGVGHTYSSAHINDDEAEKQLRSYIANTIGDEESEKLTVNKLSFTPGYREKFWHKNCVAIGMSAGFIEPLEASALAMIELSITMISEQLPQTRSQMSILAERFNKRFSYRWERVIEFLKLHYTLSQRRDSDYWCDNQLSSSTPVRLAELLELWKYQPPSRYDFTENEEIFPSASYQYILYGMSQHTQVREHQTLFENQVIAEQLFNKVQQQKQQFLQGLPTNRALINHYCQQQN